MTTAEALAAARKLIDTPEKWCKGAWGMDADGNGRDERSPFAVKWCASGACMVAGYEKRWEAWSVLSEHLPRAFDTVAAFNDDPSTTHADVMALFDRAIAAAKENP